jgi:DNA-binding NtrC family response regulator
MSSSVLIVDDEKNIRLMAGTVLKKSGYHVISVASAAEALAEMRKTEFGLAVIDYMMPGMDGIGLVEQIRLQGNERTPMVLMTAFGSAEVAVKAMRAGAADYIAKPFTADELLHVVERNLRTQTLEREVAELKSRIELFDGASRAGIIAGSPAMKSLLKMAGQVAASKAPVLIEGETGTGKECLARFLHGRSPRAMRPFVAVNCGALHPELLLSELFGHRRGAFTGAVEDRIGRFEASDGGTLFLDEISELNEGAQVKLLRVLQEGSFERVGEGRSIHVDVRIVAATNRRLEEMVADGSFRADLYYRLAVISLLVPPLRDRLEDLMPLASEFLREFAGEANRPGLEWPQNAPQTLAAYKWPGNIRELRNAVQRAVLLTQPDAVQVTLAHLLPSAVTQAPGGNATVPESLLAQAETDQWSIDELEREYMRRLLAREDLKLADVCRILEIDPATLYRKRKRYGL